MLRPKHILMFLLHNHRSSALALHAYYGVHDVLHMGMHGAGIYFFCSGFLTSGALVATGAGVGLAPTGVLVLLVAGVVLGLDILTKDCGWRWTMRCRMARRTRVDVEKGRRREERVEMR